MLKFMELGEFVAFIESDKLRGYCCKFALSAKIYGTQMNTD